ncbi:MAG: hypothetical protein IPP06_16055 [Saprospiraceae bacterium]|nr:hypothetical protein [Candidatus Vicinibacter affinis]MBP6174142.1 hypothetical protein [Saprospiraceae bacterium]MBK6572300.1 hypothetical protein [Candidatus Vicinibacter affinis]MBK6824277.1 hypothetical protein [Candidatus Vicinibacter affinis]MBK7799115.1 hypothetical protein [Candidatus Vicinibacter affinis]
MSVVKKLVRKITSTNTSTKNHTHLTKRLLLRRARAAGKLASNKAMSIMGYVVVVQNDVVIKKYQDGRTEIIDHLK